MISFVCVSFSLSASQEEVYCVCAKHIILSTLEGYNGSLIAYGQTGNASYEFLIIIISLQTFIICRTVQGQEKATQLKVGTQRKQGV